MTIFDEEKEKEDAGEEDTLKLEGENPLAKEESIEEDDEGGD